MSEQNEDVQIYQSTLNHAVFLLVEEYAGHTFFQMGIFLKVTEKAPKIIVLDSCCISKACLHLYQWQILV
jgi:hypothetical protein